MTKKLEAGARLAINARITEGLRARLQAAADQSGRTLSNEIEVRLAESFGDAPSAFHASMLSAFGHVFRDAEEQTGESLADPAATWARTLARRAATYLIKTFMGEDRGEPSGFASGIREDGTPAIPGYDHERSMAFQALRRSNLLVRDPEYPGLTFSPTLLAVYRAHTPPEKEG